MALPETHGRWPLVAAASLGPAALLALCEPRARPLAALLAHQTEEWVWPGGFLPWINRTVLGSGEDEFPIDRRLGFAINVGLGWGLSAAPLAGPRAAAPAAALYVSHLGNAALHVGWAARNRSYDPGLLTAVAALAPVGVAGLRGLAKAEDVPRSRLLAGAAAGLAISAGLVPALRARMARRNRRRRASFGS